MTAILLAPLWLPIVLAAASLAMLAVLVAALGFLLCAVSMWIGVCVWADERAGRRTEALRASAERMARS